MPISCYSLWSMTGCLKSLLEKSLGSIHVSLLAQHRVNEVPIPINGTIEVTPLPLDLDVGFIDIPGDANFSASLGAQLICHE